jgi:hypothetical protein
MKMLFINDYRKFKLTQCDKENDVVQNIPPVIAKVSLLDDVIIEIPSEAQLQLPAGQYQFLVFTGTDGTPLAMFKTSFKRTKCNSCKHEAYAYYVPYEKLINELKKNNLIGDVEELEIG